MTGDWTPSNEPDRYDHARVARIKPVDDAITAMALPLERYRKLHTIAVALEVQIEDGGDSPEVNRLLLEALRAAVHHQAAGPQANAVLEAIKRFEQAEAERWEQVRTGTLPPLVETDEERLGRLVERVVELGSTGNPGQAAAPGLEAWELVKRLARPEMRSTDDFDAAYPDLYDYTLTWCQDLEEDLGVVGQDQPEQMARRLQFVREFLNLFPDESELSQLDFKDAEAESLWFLGERAESDAIASSLVEQFPDRAAAYRYWALRYLPEEAGGSKDYARAEAILKPALDRPELDNRAGVLQELADLYHEWGKHDEEEAVAAELLTLLPAPLRSLPTQPSWALPPTFAPPQPAIVVKPGRNAPCWCGSGKKYKKCHLAADETADRQRLAEG